MIRLRRREKLLTVALAVFIAGWLLFNFAVKPTMDRIETLKRVIPEKKQELHKLRAKADEYIRLQDTLTGLQDKIAAQDKNFELLPFLESLIQEVGLEQNVEAMKQQLLPLEQNYSQSIVEIRLQNLTLNQLIQFLAKVESSNVLSKTKTLYIKTNLANKDLLDSTIEIHNARLNRNQLALK